MAVITRDKAKKIISEIYEQIHGVSTGTERDKTSASEDKSAETLQGKVLAAAAKACTDEARFVYEFIQNAEDNSYDWAISQGQHPSLTFHVFPDRILVESNEDGFEEQHVRAICSVGKQTKTGLIGEKGIGFKSVFKIAYKVQIQSGPFCFSFQHRDGDSGLGMIAPVNEDPEDLAKDVRTRFTLLLAQPGQWQKLESKLRALPDTLIAFLSKIKKVRFKFEPTEPSDICYERQLLWSSYLTLSKTSGTKQTSLGYQIYKKEITGLPRRESRGSTHPVEMVLAFPLDNGPFLGSSRMLAHAFLPLRDVGLNFLIQSDFITKDNREDLEDCPWNDHLLGSMYGLFCSTLESLPSLWRVNGNWPQYLPDYKNQSLRWQRVWEPLRKDLKYYDIFETRKGTLKNLEEVRYLLPEHCDENGDPLFDDLQEDIYLSSRYAEQHEILEQFGLQAISRRQLLERFQVYVDGLHPRILATDAKSLEDGWNDRVASLLLAWMDSPSGSMRQEIQRLRLVPVSLGYRSRRQLDFSPLKCAQDSPIYRPFDKNNNRIPEGILDLVPLHTAVSGDRSRLFLRLGVRVADPADVAEQILTQNTSRLFPLTLQESVRNLKYLYDAAPDRNTIDGSRLLLYDRDGTRGDLNAGRFISRGDIYVENDDPYGMNRIVQGLESMTVGNEQDPLHVRFLHPSYRSAFSSHPGWVEWLELIGAVRRAPRLDDLNAPDQLSATFQGIIMDRPDMLTGILCTHWNIYNKEIRHVHPSVISAIGETFVPVECGAQALEKSFLGTPELRKIWSEARLRNKFPFLTFPPKLLCQGDVVAYREVLGRFGVTTTVTAEFLREIVERLVKRTPIHRAKDALFKLYELLALTHVEDVREHLAASDIVYIPGVGDVPDQVVKMENCVWDGPSFLKATHVLASHGEYAGNQQLKSLFRSVGNIHNADWRTYLLELSYWQDMQRPPQLLLHKIYEAILEDVKDEKDWETIRLRFSEQKYIYIPSDDIWCSLSQCLWSNCTFIDQKYGVRHIYPGLEQLFVEKLRVSAPTISAYVLRLRAIAMAKDASTTDILTAIGELCCLRPTRDNLQPLRVVPFLPIRGGDEKTKFATGDDPFLILDDERFCLDNKVPILDLPVTQVCEFRQFIVPLGLQHRCISTLITEGSCPVENSRPSAELTDHFQSRGQSFYKCAVYYGSITAAQSKENTQRMLQTAIIYEAETFQRYFSVSDYTLQTKFTHGRLHLETTDGVLRIFIPRDPKQRAICYATELPRRLTQYLQIGDPAACGMFATMLREPLDILSDILEEMGICCPTVVVPPRRAAKKTTTITLPSDSGLSDFNDVRIPIRLKLHKIPSLEEKSGGSSY